MKGKEGHCREKGRKRAGQFVLCAPLSQPERKKGIGKRKTKRFHPVLVLALRSKRGEERKAAWEKKRGKEKGKKFVSIISNFPEKKREEKRPHRAVAGERRKVRKKGRGREPGCFLAPQLRE